MLWQYISKIPSYSLSLSTIQVCFPYLCPTLHLNVMIVCVILSWYFALLVSVLVANKVNNFVVVIFLQLWRISKKKPDQLKKFHNIARSMARYLISSFPPSPSLPLSLSFSLFLSLVLFLYFLFMYNRKYSEFGLPKGLSLEMLDKSNRAEEDIPSNWSEWIFFLVSAHIIMYWRRKNNYFYEISRGGPVSFNFTTIAVIQDKKCHDNDPRTFDNFNTR